MGAVYTWVRACGLDTLVIVGCTVAGAKLLVVAAVKVKQGDLCMAPVVSGAFIALNPCT